MGLQAIETVYKGYRFRSRLEARWAVFFDQIGIEWRYEDQGYELPCGKYLPDFYLPRACYGRGAFVEVKPSPAPALSRVYWAGRMAQHIRPFATGCHYFDSDDYPPKRCKSLLDRTFFYTGPYTYEFGRHSFRPIHGSEYEDMGQECPADDAMRGVLNASIQGIAECTIFFALIEDKEAFGTLVEIGYAAALKKAIILGFSGDAIPVEAADPWCEQPEAPRPFRGAVSGITPNNDLWFAAQAAERIYCGERDYIFQQFAKHMQRCDRNELRQCNELAEASSRAALLVYGDPLEALRDSASALQFGGDSDVVDERWVHSRFKAATAARQARFEHGQSGAPYAAA